MDPIQNIYAKTISKLKKMNSVFVQTRQRWSLHLFYIIINSIIIALCNLMWCCFSRFRYFYSEIRQEYRLREWLCFLPYSKWCLTWDSVDTSVIFNSEEGRWDVTCVWDCWEDTDFSCLSSSHLHFGFSSLLIVRMFTAVSADSDTVRLCLRSDL